MYNTLKVEKNETTVLRCSTTLLLLIHNIRVTTKVMLVVIIFHDPSGVFVRF